MLRNLLRYKKHPYREALHTLLYDYPNGLSAIDIADQLNISDVKCADLLKSEQLRDAIDADPYTGTLIYKSKRKIQPKFSLSKAIAIAHHHQAIITMKIISSVLATTFISIKVFDISINIFAPKNPSIINPKPEQLLIDKELAKQKKLKLASDRDDLNRRINQMMNAMVDGDCTSSWKEDKACYIEGRLLSKSEFEDELKWMKSEIMKINQQYRSVNN